jgi:hypothetical protein
MDINKIKEEKKYIENMYSSYLFIKNYVFPFSANSINSDRHLPNSSKIMPSKIMSLFLCSSSLMLSSSLVLSVESIFFSSSETKSSKREQVDSILWSVKRFA